MKKINLKKQLSVFGKLAVDELGNPLMINEAIANALAQGNSGNPIKMMSICLRLHDVGELELDDTDIEFLKHAVKSCKNASDLLLHTVITEIETQTK